jgi:hypothetical protein
VFKESLALAALRSGYELLAFVCAQLAHVADKIQLARFLETTGVSSLWFESLRCATPAHLSVRKHIWLRDVRALAAEPIRRSHLLPFGSTTILKAATPILIMFT